MSSFSDLLTTFWDHLVFPSLCCDWMGGTLISILLIGLKLDGSFERSSCAWSEPCLGDHCFCHRVSNVFLFFRGWNDSVFHATWSWLLPAFRVSSCVSFSLLFSSWFKALNASASSFCSHEDYHFQRKALTLQVFHYNWVYTVPDYFLLFVPFLHQDFKYKWNFLTTFKKQIRVAVA